jgi:addiction module HigA family antidote
LRPLRSSASLGLIMKLLTITERKLWRLRRRRINEIVHGQRRITAGTALRLARFFGTSERLWLNLQARYDLEVEKDRLGPALDEIRPMSAVGR